ncbi:MAG: hypothetical protein QXO70_04805 [Candidatus Pacearchaeota archaeon]
MHKTEEKRDNSLSGKIISFFDITKDPLYEKIKGKGGEEKKSEWEFVK